MNRTNEIIRALLESDVSGKDPEEDPGEFKDVYDTEEEPVVYLGLGSVSSGTMREEDLIPVFLGELESVAPAEAEELKNNYAREIQQADAEFCWETLMDALNDHVLPYTYFGANEGDGSDYGVWISNESIDDDLKYEDTDKLVAVNKGDPIPCTSQYVVVLDTSGDYVQLLDGKTHAEFWSI
jgi:hypothetical protein